MGHLDLEDTPAGTIDTRLPIPIARSMRGNTPHLYSLPASLRAYYVVFSLATTITVTFVLSLA